eukprot:6204568-Pleurochrysis_carterae.AAC.2
MSNCAKSLNPAFRTASVPRPGASPAPQWRRSSLPRRQRPSPRARPRRAATGASRAAPLPVAQAHT